MGRRGKSQTKVREASIQRAIDVCGGPTSLAEKIGGITPQAISQWERCPAERVIDVETASGVSRAELRPDLFGSPETRRVPLIESKAPRPTLSKIDRSDHFSRFFHLRRNNFRSAAEVEAHVGALREEWGRR